MTGVLLMLFAFGSATGGEYTMELFPPFSPLTSHLSSLAFTYDSRGLPILEMLPISQQLGSATIEHHYDALGNEVLYVDESGEQTKRFVDGLGRVFRIAYPDLTTEETLYEDKTGLVLATKNRADVWLWFTYDGGGRVTEVHRDSATGPLVLKNEYDGAGRLKRVTSDDGAIAYDEFDRLGRPGVTRTYRYRNALSANPQLIDVHSQRHVWNVWDERKSWTMPSAGGTPIAADDATTGVAIRRVVEHRDGMGNLTRLADGADQTLAEMDPRSIGRNDSMSRPVSGASLLTSFDYWDGKSSSWASGAENLGGLPRSAVTERAGTVLGGSTNQWDFSRRISRIEVPDTGRGFVFGYDDRGRLDEELRLLSQESLDTAVPIVQQQSKADQREERDAPQVLQVSQVGVLGLAAYAIERPSWTTTHLQAHQIQSKTATLEGTEEVLEVTYTWDGGRRTSDGRWNATYDALGNLRALQEITPAEGAIGPRRVEYDRDPSGRIIGRRSGFVVDGQFQLESNADSLARDGLPADATFVWDPIADRLIAIFGGGSSKSEFAKTNPLYGLVRQVLHGGQSYDDPLLMVSATGGPVRRLYPIRDEFGDGSIHAVADNAGNLAERILYADAWGDAPRHVHGPIVDRIEAQPGSDGSMKIRLRLTDPIVGTTILGGALLEIQSANGPQTVDPELEDERTLLWSFDSIEWNELSSGDAADFSIVVTEALRTPAWGDVAVEEVRPWMTEIWGVKSSRAPPGDELGLDLPLVGTWTFNYLNSLSSGTGHVLFELRDLYLAASPDSRTHILTGWKSSPFIDPLTSLVHLRNRDYDPSLGYFWTPDPLGYADSSNLYAFAAGDPVNRHDPLGLESVDINRRLLDLRSASPSASKRRQANLQRWEGQRVTRDAMADPYVQSGLQALGCIEMIAGLAAIETGAGAIAALQGADLCFSGAAGFATGTAHDPLLVQGVTAGAEALGFSPTASRWLSVGAELALGSGAYIVSRRSTGGLRSANAIEGSGAVAPSADAKLLGPRSLPARDFPWVRYQHHVTGRDYEEIWRLGSRKVGVDAHRARYFVEAKWAGRNDAAWRSSPYNPTSRYYNEERILTQARNYLTLNRLVGGKGVRYAVSNDAARRHFEQLFGRHFRREIESGLLRVWHVPGVGM